MRRQIGGGPVAAGPNATCGTADSGHNCRAAGFAQLRGSVPPITARKTAASHFNHFGVNRGRDRPRLPPGLVNAGGDEHAATGVKLAEADELQLDMKPVPAVVPPSAKPPAPMLPRSTTQPPAFAQPTAKSEPKTEAPEPLNEADAVKAGTLIIGPEISFVGNITACDRLVVEGLVEATLERCQEMVVGGKGVFKGEARTEHAEVSGRIEGNLIVRKRLMIHAAGHVSGTTTYGEIEIERGGRIVGQTEAREGAQPGRDW